MFLSRFRPLRSEKKLESHVTHYLIPFHPKMKSTIDDQNNDIPVVDPLPVKNSLFLDLQESLYRFQCMLVQQSSTDETIECNITNHYQSILDKIQSIDQLEYTSETFDIVHMVFRTYISDILPLTDKYEDILSLVLSTKINFNLEALFKENESFTRRVFFSTHDLLALPNMIDYLEGKQKETQTYQLKIAMSVIINRLQLISTWITFEKDDFNDQESILRLLLKFINSNIHSDDSIIKQLFNLLIFLTEKTILVPSFINAGFVIYILQWLEMEQLPYEIQGSCIHIFYNLAQKIEGAKALNQADGLRILKDCTYRLLDPNIINGQYGFENMQLLYCMAMSLLIEPKQNREYVKNHRRILDYLLQSIIDASNMDNFFYADFHISRPIVVLTKLFVQDEIIKYVLDEAPVKNFPLSSKVEFFANLLIRFRGALTMDEDEANPLTLTALFNILWSISFHDEYLSQLQTNRQFLLTVKTFAYDTSVMEYERYVFANMSSIFKAANGILLNLGENISTRVHESSNITVEQPLVTSIANPSNRINVMISYSHTNADFCHDLVNALQKDPRLDIWVDFIYCRSGDLWEEISEAIENAHVILFIITKEYQSSKSCRQEVMYARDTLKKRFIPIYLKNDFVANSWLGIRIVGAQYIRFGKRSFGDSITEILNLMDDNTSQKQKQNVFKQTQMLTTPIADPVNVQDKILDKNLHTSQNRSIELIMNAVAGQTKPIEQWTFEDINQWFEQNNIESKLKDLYRFQHGNDLLLYGQCLQPNWQYEYADMRERYTREYNEILYRDQFVLLVGALNRL
ncbi:unnamed protein product [Rotaria sordida]|uniref:TIR domain-containing protein n=1 Tax=Rotaria sordida TaxID=392033 RepID=A0A819ACT0_9BILA|nr:unnamed protein product [Rotaria sordida]